MADIYNLTNITSTNDTLQMMQAINTELTHSLLGNGWSIVLFVVILLLTLSIMNDIRKALLASASINFIISGIFFFAAHFVSIYLPIAYLALAIVSIILLQDKDTGP